MMLRRAWMVLIATVLGCALTARLGVWQLDRAAQKEALQAALNRGAQAPPLTAEQLIAVDPAKLVYRRARVRGHWLADKTIYLDNRPLDDHVGFYVVTPLQLQGRAESLLVQRGWLPLNLLSREKMAPYTTQAGEVEVEGRLAMAPARLFQLGDAGHGAIRQNLDPRAYARETGLALLPMALWQTQATGPADTLPRDWAPPDLGLAMHYGYAFQWFALCALILALYVWHQHIRPRTQRSEQ